MCRLAMMNKAGERYAEANGGFEALLSYLEKQAGGHGNGVALLKDGKVTFFKKGLDYTTEQCARDIQGKEYDWCIFHTRIKSVGDVTDKNCHPFRKLGIVLAMNGTEPGFTGVARMLGITDTEAVLRTSVAFNKEIELVCRDVCSSTFVGFNKGVPFVVAKDDSWSGIQCVLKDDVVLFASTLPQGYDRMRPKNYPFLWKESDPLDFKVEKVSAKKKGYGHYGNMWQNSYKKNKRDTESLHKEIEQMRLDAPKENVIDDMESITIDLSDPSDRWWD